METKEQIPATDQEVNNNLSHTESTPEIVTPGERELNTSEQYLILQNAQAQLIDLIEDSDIDRELQFKLVDVTKSHFSRESSDYYSNPIQFIDKLDMIKREYELETGRPTNFAPLRELLLQVNLKTAQSLKELQAAENAS